MQNLIKMFNNRVFLILLIVTISCAVHAQENINNNDSIKCLDNTKSDITLNTDSLIQSLRIEVISLKEKTDSLHGELSIKDQIINDKEREIKKKEQYLIFADTVIARLSNDCLRKKYGN